MKIAIASMALILSILSVGGRVGAEECIRNKEPNKPVWKDPCINCHVLSVDSIANINITGEVLDNNSKRSISDVDVIFVDSGLSERKEDTNIERTVGKSDASGNIDIAFKYFWGRTLKTEKDREDYLTGQNEYLISCFLRKGITASKSVSSCLNITIKKVRVQL